ncbi:hypothetical protein MG293_002163 [Ovis ammon polii]|uniref:Uncharacterized protein n=1 Tax=Ovis ammon polii TaxID=230172 RepID=A0AAD4UNN6_OVIAM|nr:hypothetical protein MG293_002163 [Ovis ammon polii]
MCWSILDTDNPKVMECSVEFQACEGDHTNKGPRSYSFINSERSQDSREEKSEEAVSLSSYSAQPGNRTMTVLEGTAAPGKGNLNNSDGDSMDQQHQQGLGACEKRRSQASPRPPESGSSPGQNPTFSSEKHCLSSNSLMFCNLTAFI